MPSDAERFQFIAKFRLHVAFHDDHVSLLWQEKVQHWEASPPYYPVASGRALARQRTRQSSDTIESTECRHPLSLMLKSWQSADG